jgi:hypothetical protein
VLEPVIVRYRGRGLALYFRGDAAFAKPELYELLEAEGIGYARSAAHSAGSRCGSSARDGGTTGRAGFHPALTGGPAASFAGRRRSS